MSTYAYVARDRAGKSCKGTLEGKDAQEVRQTLRSRDLYVTDLQLQKIGTNPAAGRKRKVKIGDMVIMSRQLATLVRSGIPILESLKATAEQAESQLLRDTLNTLCYDVMTGSTLSGAMKKHPKVFNPKFIALVNAGESAGILDQTLEVAAEQFDQEAELREKVKAAFVYPAIVVISSIGVVIFMLLFIVPVFSNVYEQFNAKLPAPTLILVAASTIISRYWWIVLSVLYVVIKGLKHYVGTAPGKRAYDKMTLKLPLLGKLNRKIVVARFTQTFAGCTQAGVPILQALTVSAQTANNAVFEEAIRKVITQVEQGSGLAQSLEETNEFQPLVTRMIAAGEQSGNLESMLNEVTKFFNRDIEYSVGRLTSIMEPAMTIAVGGIVLLILLALYMPIFNLSNAAQHK